MAAMCLTWVFLQAILLWDIDCSPIRNDPQYEGGSQDPGQAQPERQTYPSYDTAAGFTSEPDAHGWSSGAPPSPPPAGSSGGDSPPSSQESWAVPPHWFSGGPHASDGYGGREGQMAGSSGALPPPALEFVPGELLNVESTTEDGHYESETRERRLPPPPPPPPSSYDSAAVGWPESFLGPGVLMPRASIGSFYPYDSLFITGQFPTGTYTHSSGSVERGSDDWQENRHVGYEHPAAEEQQMQSPGGWDDQSYQLAEPEGPGEGQDVEQHFQDFDGYWPG